MHCENIYTNQLCYEVSHLRRRVEQNITKNALLISRSLQLSEDPYHIIGEIIIWRRELTDYMHFRKSMGGHVHKRMGRFSKVLSQANEIGWCCADEDLLMAWLNLKHATDLHTSVLTQCGCLRTVRDGFLQEDIFAKFETYQQIKMLISGWKALELYWYERKWDYTQGGCLYMVALPQEI